MTSAYIITVAAATQGNPGPGCIAWVLRLGHSSATTGPRRITTGTTHRAVLAAMYLALGQRRKATELPVVLRTNLIAAVQAVTNPANDSPGATAVRERIAAQRTLVTVEHLPTASNDVDLELARALAQGGLREAAVR